MKYIWQHKHWPHFEYDLNDIQDVLYHYAIATSSLVKNLNSLPHDFQIDAIIDLMVAEAIKTSEIEGEKLNYEDVRSSIKNQLGLSDKTTAHDPRAIGIAQLMIAVRKNYSQPLTKEELFLWHTMIFPETFHHKNSAIGNWRTGPEAMQIVSGTVGQEKIHYEGPPSSRVNEEMEHFIEWFNATDPIKNKVDLPGPVRSAIAHLYFECIHPFDDGNGRIGRALSEKALSQELQMPISFSLSSRIQKYKKDYYDQLSRASKDDMNITPWIEYFVKTIYAALLDSQQHVTLIIQKAQFWNHYASQLNERQAKVLARMFKEGISGFQGGINAQKYMAIAHCSKATATRDLASLVALGCIEPLPGKGRSTSYKIRITKDPLEAE
jgi:Fic family protein